MANSSATAVNATHVPVAGHMGKIFLRLAETYPTLEEMILEMIQNMIDANAKNINLYVNHQRRILTIDDDGDGVDQKTFSKALVSIGSSIKDDNKLGRWGLGLISPLGKCEEFIFVSSSKREGVYRQWKFLTNEVTQQNEVCIPCEALPDTSFCRDVNKKSSGKLKYVSWRTQIRIKNFTSDKLINKLDFDALAHEIVERYGVVMKRNNVIVKINLVSHDGKSQVKRVEAEEMTGEKISDTILHEKSSGKVMFRIYLAPLVGGKRRGKILFGEIGDDFRLNQRQFSLSVQGLLDQEVSEAIFSGIFSGEILSEKVELHPSRKSFRKDEALLGLCLCISDWYRKYGQQYIERIREEQEDSFYKKTAQEALYLVKNWLSELSESEKSDLLDFKFGTIGSGHIRPDRSGKNQEIPTVSHTAAISKNEGNGSMDRGESSREKERHMPFTVADPKGGKQRTVVRDNSVGIQIFLSELPEVDGAYRFDPLMGIVEINKKHWFFKRCQDASTSALREYQFHVVRVALLCYRYKKSFPGQSEIVKMAMEDDLRGLVFSLVNARKLQRHFTKED